MTFKNMATFLDAAKENTNANSDSNLAHKIGVTRSSVYDWRNGKSLPSESTMIKLAERAKLDVEEAILLRALWASHDETKSYYASILRKLAMCFPYIFAPAFALQVNSVKPLDYIDNSSVVVQDLGGNNKHYALTVETKNTFSKKHLFHGLIIAFLIIWLNITYAKLLTISTQRRLATSLLKCCANLQKSLNIAPIF